jgi:GNAT superfamily N-acetyltransferase
VNVRAARAAERPALSELAFRSKAYWGYDDAFMAACREELQVAPADIAAGRVVVLERDGVVAGFATVTGDPPDAELEAMFVEPAAIRGGVGTALLGAATGLARDLGCTRLLIEADPNAVPFYERQGAVRIGERPSASIPGRALPLLALGLS